MSEFKKRELKPKESLGQHLSRRREGLRLNIGTLAEELKIRPSYLIAIEKGDYRALPADVYVRGFLRSYAKRLGLNVERVLSVFKKERALDMEVINSKVTARPKKSQQLTRPKVVITPRTLGALGLALLALFLSTYLISQFFSFLRPPMLTVTSPLEDEVSVENSDNIYIEGRTDAGADVFINNFQIKVSPDGSFSENITLKHGVNIIEIKSVSSLNKVATITKKITSGLESEVLKDFEDKQNRISGVQVTLVVVSDRALIEVWADDKPVYGGDGSIFEAGARKRYKANTSLRIKVNNAGAVKVIVTNSKVSGREIGPLGEDNQTVTVEYRFDQKL